MPLARGNEGRPLSAQLEPSDETDYHDPELLPVLQQPGYSLAPGFWAGAIAPDLNLLGPCTRVDFHSLERNRHPLSGRKLRPRRSKRAHHSCLITVPLSASVLAVFDRNVPKLLTQAFLEVLPFIERLCAKRRGGGPVCAIGLAVVYFIHFASRANEPGLHLHVIIFNLLQTAKRYRALNATSLYAARQLLGVAIAARFAALLRKAGYVIVPDSTTGLFRIAGVPVSAERHFASRRRAIVARLPHHLVDPRARRRASDYIAIETRERKKDRNPEARVEAEVLAKMTQDEIAQVRGLVDRAAKALPFSPSRTDLSSALRDAATSLLRRVGTASESDFLCDAMRRHFGEDITLEQWQDELSHIPQLQRAGDVYRGSTYAETLRELQILKVPFLEVRDSATLAAVRQLADETGASLICAGLEETSPWEEALNARYTRDSQLMNAAASGAIVAVIIERASAWVPSRLAAVIRCARNWARSVFCIFRRNDSRQDRAAGKLLREAMIPVLLGPRPEVASYRLEMPWSGASRELFASEVRLADDRLAVLSALYVREVQRRHLCLIASSSLSAGDQVLVEQRIRKVFEEHGLIKDGAYRIPRLIARGAFFDGTRASAAQLVSAVLQFSQNPKLRGFGGRRLKRGDRLKVVRVHEEEVDVTLNTTDDAMTVPVQLLRGCEVYEEAEIEVRIGDYLTVTKMLRVPGIPRLQPGKPYKVTGIDVGLLTLEKTYRLPLHYGHLRYAYLSTSHEPGARPIRSTRLLLDRDPRLTREDILADLAISTAGSRLVVLTPDAAKLAGVLGATLAAMPTIGGAELFADHRPRAKVLPLEFIDLHAKPKTPAPGIIPPPDRATHMLSRASPG